MGFLKGKTAIITGGGRAVLSDGSCGSIGYGIATAYAKEGANLVITGRNLQKLEDAKEELERLYGIQVLPVQADVNAGTDNEAAVANVVKQAIDTFGRIDVLINNAGISQEGLFTDVTEEEWQKIINTNLNSVFYCNQQALKYMIPEQQGCIINISSIWGETGASCEVAYSTTKAAINGMTKALAKEVGPSNIRVNAIAPGIIDTDMNRNLTNEELEQIKEQIPLNKIGKALDIAKCVKWLIEDEYTTGQIISINGGWYIYKNSKLITSYFFI